MNTDRKLIISIGQSRTSKQWTRTETMWSEFINRLSQPIRTQETVAEYHQLSKSEQGKLKDIGGFVGGSLNGLQRKAINVTGRDLITLDLDSIMPGETDNVVRTVDSLGMAYVIYSTRSHTEHRPRLRVVIPTDRTMTPDEYEPIARKMAELIGIGMMDSTTFEASRLMYWPGCSSDAQYVFHYADKQFLSADGMLAKYTDWRDVSTWPQVPGSEVSVKVKQLLTKQQDPLTKHGIVGAFCQTYGIREAIDNFIPHAYTYVDGTNDRLTYAEGTTVGGAVIYDDDKFLYSHHNTDPCGGQLVNAFDLVRLHKFRDLDETAKDGTPAHKMPSFLAMAKFAQSDANVLLALQQDRARESALNVFADLVTDADRAQLTDLDANALTDVSWMANAKLACDENGKYKKTRDNILKILAHDPVLSGRIAYDKFGSRYMAMGALPWAPTENGIRIWTDTDDSGIQWYLEQRYDITGKDKVLDSVLLCAEQNSFNPVTEYLSRLIWDGVERLDSIFIDYLGAQDNVYTRAVGRKSFVAAVARAFNPGCKYDTMLVLIGSQGIGKSSLIRIMGKDWYADGLNTFDGKEAAESIQGLWLIEAGEMAGYSKAEENASKQFLSRQVDVFRKSYGRRTQEYPRQCVFFGSTNQHEFLKDSTGNRRFWPIQLGFSKPSKSVFENLPGEVDQLWAEAVHRYRQGESLIIEDNHDVLELANAARQSHMEGNAKAGIIEEYLKKKVPTNWNTMSPSARQMFLSTSAMQPEQELVYRDRICAAEVWVECFNKDISWMKKIDTREINQILDNLTFLLRYDKVQKFGPYGAQRGFRIQPEMMQ